MARFIREVEPRELTQCFLQHSLGTSSLAWNQTVNLMHYGEDGPGYEIGVTRCMFIEEEIDMHSVSEFQEWAFVERADQWYASAELNYGDS